MPLFRHRFLRIGLVAFIGWTASAAPIRLTVDAGDTVHKVVHVRENIPLEGRSSITLLYPEWELASHAPTVAVSELAGLKTTVNGRAVDWRRDPVNMHAFHIAVPPGATTLDVTFDYLSPLSNGFITNNIAQVQWQHVLLYPQGSDVRQIEIVARLRLPPEFKAASSLETARIENGNVVEFGQTSLSTLVDSPVFAGRFLQSWSLGGSEGHPVTLSAVADSPEDLNLSAPELDALRGVVAKTGSSFGKAPFRRYCFLVSLSNFLPNDGGAEHAESSEISLPADYFLKPAQHKSMAEIFAHEYVHVWNGLLHRPAGMAVSDFNTPMQDSLLWVYEGLTEFWAFRIALEAGQISQAEYRDLLAIDAAEAIERPGREWKSLADSDNDPIYLAGHHVTWRDWERREDYYVEGPLLWLAVDARIRTATQGKKTLADFTRGFFASAPARTGYVPYTFSDLTAALHQIAALDWSSFFDAWLYTHDAAHILDGLRESGYRLVFDETPSGIFQEEEAGDADLTYSIGAVVSSKGTVRSVAWKKPAFLAGLTPGTKIVAVNGTPFNTDGFLSAVRDSGRKQLRLTVLDEQGSTEDLTLDYHLGLRYPHLRTTGK